MTLSLLFPFFKLNIFGRIIYSLSISVVALIVAKLWRGGGGFTPLPTPALDDEKDRGLDSVDMITFM